MNLNGLRKKVGGAALLFVMALGITLSASTSAQAQWRDYDNRNDRYGQYNDDRVRWDSQRTKQYAFLLGYHNAYTEGKEAYERRSGADYNDMPGYRQGTNGWLAWMGHQDSYKDAYRKGYEVGFKDGQQRRGRRYSKEDVERALGGNLKDVYGNDSYYDDDGYYRGGRDSRNDRDRGDYRNGRYNREEIFRIAQQNGYNRGFRHGEEDRSRRRRYNYDNANEYRNAIDGYRSEYGDRSVYQQGFRDGYRQGYDDAFRSRGRRNNTSGSIRWPF